MCDKLKDYCTLWFEGSWKCCCARHDKRYANKRLTRYQADILLYRCVKCKSNRFIASLMFIGVSFFGWIRY